MLPSPRLLAAARMLANVTQAELAELAGVSVSAVRRLEVGDTDARARTVEAFAKTMAALGVEIFVDQAGSLEGLRHARPSPPNQDGRPRKRVGAARSRAG